MLRGLWIFHAEADVRLLMSRRFPTVERKMQRLLGDDYTALPCDEDISMMFVSEILHEREDHCIPPGIPEPFHEDFEQGSFSWKGAQEKYLERLWPMGPVCSINDGKIWPLLFLFKRGFYLVTVVALEKKYKVETVRTLDFPQITAAFAVLEDICDFIPAALTISDVAGIAELQYYIRSAIPFGSPVNTNYQLLRLVRQGFPNKEEEPGQRSPAWKPYLTRASPNLVCRLLKPLLAHYMGNRNTRTNATFLATFTVVLIWQASQKSAFPCPSRANRNQPLRSASTIALMLSEALKPQRKNPSKFPAHLQQGLSCYVGTRALKAQSFQFGDSTR